MRDGVPVGLPERVCVPDCVTVCEGVAVEVIEGVLEREDPADGVPV